MTALVLAGPLIAGTAAAIFYAGFRVGGRMGTAEARAAAHAESSARLAVLLSRLSAVQRDDDDGFDWSAIGLGDER